MSDDKGGMRLEDVRLRSRRVRFSNLGFVAGLGIFVLLNLFTWRSHQKVREAERSWRVLSDQSALLSQVESSRSAAEIAYQRYALHRSPQALEDFDLTAELAKQSARRLVEEVSTGDPLARGLVRLDFLVHKRMQFLQERLVSLRSERLSERRGGSAADGSGGDEELLRALDAARTPVEEIRQSLRERTYEARGDLRVAIICAATLTFMLLCIVFVLFRRAILNQVEGAWLVKSEGRFADIAATATSMPDFGERLLSVFAHTVGAVAGALYVQDVPRDYRLEASIGHSPNRRLPKIVREGEGLLASALRSRKVVVIADFPTSEFNVGSVLGEWQPKALVLIPVLRGDAVVGLVELALFKEPLAKEIELFDRIRPFLASALLSLASTRELEERSALLAEVRQELESKGADLERLSRFKSEFLANMSHELRSPIGAIVGLTELLESEGDFGRRHEYLRSIRSNSNHLTELIHNLLDLSKAESGKLEIEPRPVDPRALIEEALSSIRPQAEIQGLELRSSVDPAVAQFLMLDAMRVKQIIGNVLGNAVKFTPSGFVELNAKLDARGGGKATLVIDVIDTGGGITPGSEESIFLPFYQTETTLPRRFEGTGLGLPLARRLAEAMSGSLTVQTTSPEGTVMRLTLPHQQTLMPRFGASASPSLEKLSLENSSVLVVEDSKHIRMFVHRVLEQAGARVSLAEDGLQGLNLMLQQKFDVVLLDVQLPGLDGFQVLQRARAQVPLPPVIAFTSHALDEQIEDCWRAGFSAVINKPVDREGLLKALKEALYRARDVSSVRQVVWDWAQEKEQGKSPAPPS